MEVTTKIENKADVARVISELSEQRKIWEAGAYAASNSALYAILGRTLDLLYRVKHYTNLSRGLNALLDERGFKFTDATSTETKLLRAVFADPAKPDQYKQRIYVYARVLSVAYEAKVTGAELPAFIEQRGGIDEIRRHEPKTADKTQENKGLVHTAEKALNIISHTAIATGIKLTPELQPVDDQFFSIALVRKDADGTGSIVFGTNSKALVQSVLVIAGRKVDADAEVARKRETAASIAAEREMYVELAKAELSDLTVNDAAETAAVSEVENIIA